jgi:ureidoglycolate hydrolase
MGEVEKKIEAKGLRKHDYFDIIARLESEPLFTNHLLDFWSPIGILATKQERMEVGLCSIKKNFDRFDRMERHLESVEIIIPVSDSLFIPVAPPESTPDPEKIRIIPVQVGEIINLHPCVWHFAYGPIRAVSRKKPLEYLVLLKSGTPTDDLEMVELNQEVRILR